MTETRHTFCRICEALCGLRVDVDGERVVQIRPDPEHVTTSGFGCVKGLKQHEIYDSADRLTHPLQLVSGDHVRVSWDDALGGIGARVRRIVAEHGPNAVAMYVGTAAGFSFLHPIFAQGFMTGIGSENMFSSATQDCSNKFAAAHHIYGFPFLQPFPDVDRTQCLIVVGANPAISKWSFLQVPNPIRRLKAIEARGGKVYVVDPRRTETAKVAGEHLFIRPDTDVFFYLSFLCELEAQGGIDPARAEPHMTGLDEALALARAWPAERTEPVTQVPAGRLRELVRDYREADGAALYSSTGVNMGTNGVLAFWIQEVINAASGNLDRRGGTLVGRGLVDFPGFAAKRGILMRSARSRVGDFGSVNDAFPGGILADEILTPGEGQIRALFVTGGNPLLTMANAARMREAFEHLDLLVALDILPGETAAMADYVLPCTSPLQRPDLPFVFPSFLGMQTRPYVQATRAVVPPLAEQRDEPSIYLDLCRACGVNMFGSAVAQRTLELARRWRGESHEAHAGSIPQEAILSLFLRLAGQGSFERLADEAHGRLRPDHAGDDFLGKRVLTDDKKVHLAPPALVERASRLNDDFEGQLARRDDLRLITRRAITTHNSWTHNHPDFVEGARGTNYLYVHSLDAERLGLRDGALAEVATDTARLRVPVRILDDLMPGTVALPHGWGHQRAKGLGVASRTRGVNVNLLAADGPGRIDPLSGMAHLTGIPVEVHPTNETASADTWSGMPDDSSTISA